MQRTKDGTLYSASDLLNFLGCPHATYLDLADLETPLPRAVDDAGLQLLQDKGMEHERTYLQDLRKQGLEVVEVPAEASLEERYDGTIAAMASGADVIYQAVLVRRPFYGYADFLRRVDGSSSFGTYCYEAVDTKLARAPAARHAIQLCTYSDLLASVQGTMPVSMHLVLGDGRDLGLRVVEYSHYYKRARQRFESYCAKPPRVSYPQPCRYCTLCRWRELCDDRWVKDDHLHLVADITRSQIEKLNDAGVMTLRALAKMKGGSKVPRLSQAIFDRLRHQAELQTRKRDIGKDIVDILPVETGCGFQRMPKPDPGDLFFDMEGDPLYPDGLEYLFGLYWMEEGKPNFRPFWGHDHDQERRAFEAAMSFMEQHLRHWPHAHVYHYAHYEVTAITRLASSYATQEAFVDDLLRRQKLVDLYRVVREGIRVSEPSYSIKNLETFYMKERRGSVKTAAESIVVYEEWRKSHNDAKLQDIAAYNEADCESAMLLRDWLVKLRPTGAEWRPEVNPDTNPDKLESRTSAQMRHDEYVRRLTTSGTEPVSDVRQLIADMLDFHRREAKPAWWAMFDRQGRTTDELIDDAECLGGLERDPRTPPKPVQRSLFHIYRFPPQEFKFAVGDTCLRSDTLDKAGTVEFLDGDSGIVQLKCGPSVPPLPNNLSIIPTGPLDAKPLREALYRFADVVLQGDAQYGAVRDLLARATPRLNGRRAGRPVAKDNAGIVSETVNAVSAMSNTCLFIQGPPGAGKTFTSSEVIIRLIASRYRVGIASNSHKAINNLLREIEKRAVEQQVTFRGIKKSTGQNPDSFFHGTKIRDVTSNQDVELDANLIAGTAWLFADEKFDQHLDYLFVDEAGQVALANMVAMGLSAQNIVLVGDQMQLGQPIQGVHPGESGLSVLEYLLRDDATIPPDRGIFLPTTWRMQEGVCRFISDAVYDGRLHPEPENQKQTLILNKKSDPALMPTGIRFIGIEHQGCSQKSEPEGKRLREIYFSLLNQRYRDRKRREHAMGSENILVVTPYNVQVNYLKSILPDGARVGTVDKFQGQEAEVVLISMVTSSGEDLPRNIEFLYSRNRLNVAISRARCLAVILASPRLLEIPCQSIEQIRLVNTLCWAREYADSTSGE